MNGEDIMKKTKTRRAKLFSFSFELLSEMFRDGFHNERKSIYLIENGFPKDAECIDCHVDVFNGVIDFKVISDQFPVVESGSHLERERIKLKVFHPRSMEKVES